MKPYQDPEGTSSQRQLNFYRDLVELLPGHLLPNVNNYNNHGVPDIEERVEVISAFIGILGIDPEDLGFYLTDDESQRKTSEESLESPKSEFLPVVEFLFDIPSAYDKFRQSNPAIPELKNKLARHVVETANKMIPEKVYLEEHKNITSTLYEMYQQATIGQLTYVRLLVLLDDVTRQEKTAKLETKKNTANYGVGELMRIMTAKEAGQVTINGVYTDWNYQVGSQYLKAFLKAFSESEQSTEIFSQPLFKNFTEMVMKKEDIQSMELATLRVQTYVAYAIEKIYMPEKTEDKTS